MGFFQKLGLVEQEEEVMGMPVEQTQDTPVTEVDAEIKSAANVVDDIYSQNDLADKGDSIYAVQQYIDTLPAEMPTKTKQKTVSGILAVSQKPVVELVMDAQNRINVLDAAKIKIVGDYTAEIDAANNDIETMKKAIEAANIKIKEYQDIIEATNQSVNAEVKKLNELVEFCNGMEMK